MKSLLFLLFFAPFAAFANPTLDGNPNIEAISTALKTGDVETLSRFFADQVEVSINEKEQVYSKSGAKTALKSFFDSTQPQGFVAIHQGTSRESSDQYCIGNLSTAGDKYRVYIYFKVVGGNTLIQELRFDKA